MRPARVARLLIRGAVHPIAALCVLAAIASCGPATSAPPTPPSNRAAATPDAAVSSESCYPYDRRDGVCLTKCEWSTPGTPGCAKSEWPLICNRDGTCTPEMRFDR